MLKIFRNDQRKQKNKKKDQKASLLRPSAYSSQNTQFVMVNEEKKCTK